MAVSSVSFPQPQAYSGGIDWSPLANLGNVYQQAQERNMQQAALSRLGNDPTANAQALIGSGVPSLAQLGIQMQGQQATRAEQQREFEAQQALRVRQDQRAEAEARRQQTDWEENTPEGRAAKLKKNNQDPNAPEWQTWVATGAGAPSYQQLEELKLRQGQDQRAAQELKIREAEEQRKATEFQQTQQLATPDQREAYARAHGLKIDDPAVRAWIVTNQNFPTARVGTGPPSYVKGPDGQIHEFRQSSTGEPVETQYPPGYSPMSPTELAEAKKTPTAADRKAIRDADAQTEAARTAIVSLNHMKELSNQAWHLGPATGAAGYATSFLPEGYGGTSGAATEELRNEALQRMMTNVKSAFGGNPSNKEDQWLLEAQASSDKSQKVQQDIIDRGIQLMQDRLQYNRDQADELRKGTYYGAEHKEFTGSQPTTAKPSLKDFMEKARAANPGTPDSDLARYWKQKYGG